MADILKRWLSPAMLVAMLLASASFGCQFEYRLNDDDRAALSDTPPHHTPDTSASKRPDVLPASALHQEDAPKPMVLPPAPTTLAAPAVMPGGPIAGVVNGPMPNLPLPTEKAPTMHPAYIIEPPDILMIQPVRLIPKPPYHVEPLDILQIQVSEALPNQPINGAYVVSPEGMVNLGYGYGVVRVGTLTIEQAALAIKKQLQLAIKEPQVAVSLLQFRGVQQTAGEHLVYQDGSITLGSYGSVIVTGMTLCQAKAAIERHLSQYLLDPEISLSINAFNSKVYYVINDGAGFGQTVNRFPITGKEFVLDAIALNGGKAPVSSSKRMWLARPGPAGACCYKILPIDWDAITQGGDTTTNYQIFPGDRIFVDSDCLLWLNNAMTKIFAPIEQVLGITLLGTTTYEALNGNLFTNTNH